MNPKCIAEVNKAVGREMSDAEISGIENRISRHLHQMARKDAQNFRAMSDTERMNAAAKLAADELVSEQTKKAQRVSLQVMATSRAMNRLNELRAEHKTSAAALVKQLEQTDAYVRGVQHEYFSALMDTIEAAEPRFLGLLENREAVGDFVREVFGQKTGNEIAAKGARAWLDTIEQMRTRFNSAGGDVRKLDYGYLPQPHDAVAVRAMSADAWANQVLPLLDRSRYLNDDGRLMNDGQMMDFLRTAHETIATGGVNKIEPGQYRGNGMRANHGNEARQIHFKDADGFMAYMQQFGRGTVFDTLQARVYGLARDIGLVESMGPNPEHLFRQLNDVSVKFDQGKKLVGPFLIRAQDAWNVLSGYTSQTEHQRLGNLAQGARNYTVAAKLQSVLLSSFNDVPTLFMTTRYNNMPMFETFANVIRSFGSESADYANRVGLVADSVVSDMNRWAEGNIGNNWTSRLANTTMKLSLINAWTDALRRGFSLTMMGSLGKLSRLEWSALENADRVRMAAKGITEADWQVWRLAQPENWREAAMLTPEAIRAIPDESLASLGNPERLRNQAVSKLLGFITDESEYAVIGPDLMTRAGITRGTQKGTIEGEFLRSLMLFKSFPMAMISRHLRRAAEMDSTMGAIAYAVQLGIGLTLFGALSNQAHDMKEGKDPRDMTDPKFWAAAFIKGGGVGIYGDLLHTGMGGNNRGGAPNWTSLAGPVFGSGFDLANLSLGNLRQAIDGGETNAGAELARFSKQNMPLVNLWYAKAAIDHMFYHEMLEELSPGYLRRMRQRAQREFDQRFWWEPGEVMPDRAPDFEAAIGE
jgi:hypothetical protein